MPPGRLPALRHPSQGIVVLNLCVFGTHCGGSKEVISVSVNSYGRAVRIVDWTYEFAVIGALLSFSARRKRTRIKFLEAWESIGGWYGKRSS